MRLVFLDDDDPAPSKQDPAPSGKILPFRSRRAPDWLIGPGEDLGGVDDPSALEAELAALPTPVLTRPGAPAEAQVEAPAEAQVEMVPGIEPACEWAGGPEPQPEATPAEAERPAEAETRKPRRSRTSDPSARWAPVASSAPIPRLTLVERTEPENAESREAAPPPQSKPLPGRDEDLRQTGAVRPAPPPLVEPWWVIALDALRTSRRVQLVAASTLAAVVLLAVWMWPRGVGTTPLSQLRRHPTRYDGRNVVVRGRVGDDVFAVGTGWAFYLMQGRDTIVAFSLSRMPAPRKVVTLKGQVSTGFLDGMPRQALFESGAPQQ